MQKIKPFNIAWLIFSAIGYGLVAFVIARHETEYLLPVYGFLFIGFVFILRTADDKDLSFFIFSAFFFRVIFFFSMPTLSDDFYRFVWDGRLWNAGLHPFSRLPAEYLEYGIAGIDQNLFLALNSKEYFTIYPPISQSVFWVAVKIFPNSLSGSVLVMHTIIFLAEAGSILLYSKLLKKFNLAQKQLLMFALNPLVIIELMGNLHFEALMIFFLLAAVYALAISRWWISTFSIALAIGTKLIPIILFPVLVRTLGWKKFFLYAAITGAFLILCFAPMLNGQLINAMSSSIGLYFNKFEFNASLYYLVREFGYIWYGYNIIQTVGWKLAVLVFILILVFSFRKMNALEWKRNFGSWMVEDWMFVLMIYFAFTTTMHPWYATTLLALSVFTNYRFPLVWSGLIFLSYAGYTHNSFKENLWLTFLEYLIVYSFLIYELYVEGIFSRVLKR